MPIITFWSNNEKAIGQTVAASLTATVAAIEHNYKILLISADANNKMIEQSFGAQESNREIVKGIVSQAQLNLDSGINGLLKLSESNRVIPEIIHDYTKIVFNNRLDVLYSPINILDEKKFLENIKNIIISASKYYDYIFVDLRKGLKYAEQIEILNLSDVIVANTDQRVETIEKILNEKEIRRMHKKMIWNICKNDKNSKYNSKNLSRKLLKKERICEIDYNTLVFEATQEGGIPELMLKFRTLKEEDENKAFVSKIKKMIETIMIKYRELRTGM